MGATANYTLPYPEDAPGVPNQVPLDIKALADATDGALGTAQPTLLTGSGVINTTETKTGAGWNHLTTIGPQATVTVGASGRVLVIISADISSDTAGAGALMALAISGANTAAEDANQAARGTQDGAHTTRERTLFFQGLAAGATTFTAKYFVTAGTGAFARRRLIAIAL